MLPLDDSELANRRRSYSLWRFKTQAASSQQYQRFPASGDTLTIHKIDGPGVIQVRLGGPPLPWIHVAEGTVLTREYSVFYIRDAMKYDDEAQTSVLAYSSFGPLINRPFKTHGSKGPPRGMNQNVATANAQTLANYTSVFDSMSLGSFDGGFLLVQNDGAITLYVGAETYGIVPDTQSGYPLRPGASVAFDVDGLLGSYHDLLVGAAPYDFCFWTHGGNCEFSMLFDRNRRDRSEPDLNVAQTLRLKVEE